MGGYLEDIWAVTADTNSCVFPSDSSLKSLLHLREGVQVQSAWLPGWTLKQRERRESRGRAGGLLRPYFHHQDRQFENVLIGGGQSPSSIHLASQMTYCTSQNRVNEKQFQPLSDNVCTESQKYHRIITFFHIIVLTTTDRSTFI